VYFSLALLMEAVVATFGIRSQYEQPKYEVIERLQNNVEIRRYDSRMIAEVTVEPMDEGKGRNEAFGILAKYIFGENRKKNNIAMTSPVETGMTGSQEISMTAPVETRVVSGGSVTMRFFLPLSITLENAPTPNDSRVRIGKLPQETIAAFTFSGRATAGVVDGYNKELSRALVGTVWRAQGQHFTLLYDPPFTIPFLRRNEVALRVTAM
jgi:SOUL heme-binding protein